MKFDIFYKYAPPGIVLRPEASVLTAGGILSFLYSFSFLFRYIDELHSLYLAMEIQTDRYFTDGMIIKDFHTLLGNSLNGFGITALIMLGFIIYHYAYYYQGSKSIYLMRRLPNRIELHKRALTLPICAAALCLLVALAILILNYGIYMLFTPDQWLAPDQWGKLWRNLI